ncbi:MAG TPA: protein kinase, partial [Candidatus Eisenbacteria bacterium]|nr:protein kinase [Candidatus Eisenbacteria bacterium]
MALGALVLAERRGGRSPGEGWTALAPDGPLVDVWCLAGLEAASRSRCLDSLSALSAVRHPNLVPVLAVGEREGGVWVVSELDAGRPLRRLLAIATLTPEQAARVTVGVLDGLRALHEADLWHGRLDERTVHVGAAGQIRLGAWGLDVDGQDRA